MVDELYAIRHSAAHILAQAVLELFPDTQITIGPVTENGFFYDFLPKTNFKEEDLFRIEEKMREIVKKDYKIEGKQYSKAEARKIYKDNPFKLEIIDGLKDDTVGIYTQGKFSDLCKGGHTISTGGVKYFKLLSISGAYWRADRSGIALQRITGVAFETKEDLDKYLQRLEDSKLYDHRRLGKQLDLFSFHDESPGCAFFHSKGTKVYNKLIQYSRKLHKDYLEIKTPLIMNEQLWKTSGHYDNYKDNMYFTAVDDEQYCIRPMNCPGTMLLYKEKPHSYRELPLRLFEYGLVHRYELSGALHGLFRVRSFTIDDSHIYCTLDQIEKEVLNILKLAHTIYKKFSFEKIYVSLSTRPKKSMGTDNVWDQSTAALKSALDSSGLEYDIHEGDGAFYGPKIDLQVEDFMERRWQCGTIQLDFLQPKNFDLEYIDSDQSRKQPVIIHRAIYGSVERFFGVILEHFKGKLPFWLSPEQIRILIITDAQKEYATTILNKLSEDGIEVTLDDSGDQISAQIRKAQVDQVPWMLVIGQKEQTQNTVTLRYNDGKQEFGLKLEDVIAKVRQLIEI